MFSTPQRCSGPGLRFPFSGIFSQYICSLTTNTIRVLFFTQGEVYPLLGPSHSNLHWDSIHVVGIPKIQRRGFVQC